MAEESNKENFAAGLFQSRGTSSNNDLDPRKKHKTRSLSMGPGAAVQQLKEDSGNRRKSMMPAVRSILSTANDTKTPDEAAKRKAARRKSLANRRVSFAPEATLHTWDVVEYMRDATSSSAASEEARRASSISQVEPQTPTINLDSEIDTIFSAIDSTAGATPATQAQQNKDDPGPMLDFETSDGEDEEDDLGDATMELDEESEENNIAGGGLTSSSSQLDDALRQASAAAKANTQNFVVEDEDDQTMELAADEITAAFKPWFIHNRRTSGGIRQASAANDKENENPFISRNELRRETDAETESDTMEDVTMDVTMALGGIIQQQPAEVAQLQPTKSLKRTRTSTNITVVANSSGSPTVQTTKRHSLVRRRSSTTPLPMDDVTMDFTVAVGGIKQVARQEEEDVAEVSLLDQTMDFTVGVGSIKHMHEQDGSTGVTEHLADTEMLEDLSMELTANLGKALTNPVNTVAPSPIPSPSPASETAPAPTHSIDRATTPIKKSPATPELMLLSPERQRPIRESPRRSLRSELMTSHSDTPSNTVASAPTFVPRISTPTQTESLSSHDNISLAMTDPTKAFKSSMSDTLRLLLTPRKEILPTPAFASTSQATPKRSSPRKAPTPNKRAAESSRYVSPRKRVRMDMEPDLVQEPQVNVQDNNAGDLISLPDFLNMTGIRFMDLTTTKRRATGYPGADGTIFKLADDTVEELEPSMENKVAAAVSITPMMQMYQHSCQEMKSYIASGRTDIRNIEAAAIESQPPLFHDYANASYQEKAIMDNQLRDLKTNARLQSKSGWHTWRSQLLNDLKNGLVQTVEELEQDSKLLGPVEQSFSKVTPIIEQQHDKLQSELKGLQQRKQDADDGREADLDDARERLTATEAELMQKRTLVERLRSEMVEKNSRLDDARSWKAETIGAIKQADLISEECRGWSTNEVLALNDKLTSLEAEIGWSLVSASPGQITMKHNDIHLSIDPRSWLTKSNTPASDLANTPISISYAKDSESEQDDAATTVRRFFLQYIRAQAYTLPQFSTSIITLTRLLQNGWQLGRSTLAAVQSLELSGPTYVHILGDEKLGIEALMFLPLLQTKIRVQFVIDVAVDTTNTQFSGSVEVSAQVVYGERYDEPKMSSFLQLSITDGKVGSEIEARKWATGLDELKERLARIGQKGVRRV